MLSAIFFGSSGGGSSGPARRRNTDDYNYNNRGSGASGANGGTSIFSFLKKGKETSNNTTSSSPSNQRTPSTSKRHHTSSSSSSDTPSNFQNSSILRSLKKAAESPSPPPVAAAAAAPKKSSSKKPTKHQEQTTGSLTTAVLRPAVGGYASDQPQRSFAYTEDNNTLSKQNLSLLASHPVFPKPAGFLYSVRSALSSTHSLSQLFSPSPGMSKKHRSKDGKSRRGSHSSRGNETVTNLNGNSKGLASIREESQDPKDSSQQLSKKDSTKSKSKSSSKHHRDSEEKERRRKKREKEKERERELAREKDRTKDKAKRDREKGKEKSKSKRDDSNSPSRDSFKSNLEAPSRAPPAPPTPVTIDFRSEFNRTPMTARDSQLKLDYSSLLQAVSLALSSDKVQRQILNHATIDSDNFRVTLEQVDDGIKLRTIPSGLHGPGLEDDVASEPESAGAVTPKAGRSVTGHPIGREPVVKVVDHDVSHIFPDASEPIDFLLPFGGLDERFDSGYEIENEFSEDEYSVSSSAQDGSRRESKLLSSAGNRNSMYSKASWASSFSTGPDPLTTQLPVLLSLVDNTLSAYETIIDNRGSFAVGIGGYKSVARRLLDRVDTLFTRELGKDAASWGELLEVVGGRRNLPLLTPVNPDDEDDLMELLGDNLEKREIYDTCLEVPEILEPAMKGMSRLYPNSAVPITREVTALFLTTFPQFRPILQAAAEVTSNELELLKSKRFASFLETDGIKTDEERELKECVKVDSGLEKALLELENVSRRLRDIQSAVRTRKMLIESRIQAPSTEMFEQQQTAMPMEVRDAIKEIHIQSWREDELHSRPESERAPLPISENMEDLDDTSSIVPDDSASQIYVPRPPRDHHHRAAVPATIYEEPQRPPPRTPEQMGEDHFAKDPSPATMKFFKHARSPSPSAASIRSVGSVATMLSQSAKKKKKHALVRVALADNVFREGRSTTPGVHSRKSNGVLRHGSLRESEMTASSSSSAQSSTLRTPTPGVSSHTSESTAPSPASKSSERSRRKDRNRESGAGTPTGSRRQKGFGGYGSSTPVNATSRTAPIPMKEKEGKDDKLERKSSKKKKEKEHNSDSGSSEDKPKRSRSLRELLS